jgi:hypothetical protein
MPKNKIPKPGMQEALDCTGLKCYTKEAAVIY